MPYSESGGQFWAPPATNPILGADLSAPPTVVAPEVVLPLDPARDLKRVVHLGPGPGGEALLAAVQRDGPTFYLSTLSHSPENGWGLEGELVQPDLWEIYDARRLEAGGRAFLACAGVDWNRSEPAPFVAVFGLEGLALAERSRRYVVDDPGQSDSTFHAHVAVGRSPGEFIVLHDHGDAQYLAYRAFGLDAAGQAAPLCDWAPMPHPLGPTGPGVGPFFELLEVRADAGLYALSAFLEDGGEQTHVWAVRFGPGYTPALSADTASVGGRVAITFAHPLAPGRAAVGISYGDFAS